MNHKIKYIFLIIPILIIGQSSFANSAQPGIWQAGGTGVFTLHYPEDSYGYKKIRMQSEQIYMKLYPGFAVVKGTYVFENTEDSTINIKVGYPINNVFPEMNRGGKLNNVWFDELYGIKANWDGLDAPLLKDTFTNWYVWNGVFAPNQKTTFNVYFIVNTNNAQQIQGYNKSYNNSFIYLIETGSIWKSPIDSGDFYVFLEEKIDFSSLRSNRNSDLGWNNKKRALYMHLEDYGYEPDENLVITYNNRMDSFDFNSILEKSERYFLELDSYEKLEIKKLKFETFQSKSPYDVKGMGNIITTSIMWFLYLLPILGIILALFIIYKIVKHFRKK